MVGRTDTHFQIEFAWAMLFIPSTMQVSRRRTPLPFASIAPDVLLHFSEYGSPKRVG